MEKEQANTTRGIGIVSLVLGVWLIIAPLVLGYSGGATANSIVLGVIVSALALFQLSMPHQTWTSWLSGVAGLWLILAPFVLGFTEPAVLWNQIIVGIVVAGLGFWNSALVIPTHPTIHHRTM